MFVRGNLIWQRPMKRHPDPNSRDWEQIAEDLQQTADSLPPGDDKQAAEQKLQRTKRAVEIRNWLTSPRVRPPLVLPADHQHSLGFQAIGRWRSREDSNFRPTV
jgi:thioesterase domain-containing protein